jgi:hypothetical protein
MPGVKGVFVGGCVAKGTLTPLGVVIKGDVEAHAHNWRQDQYFGWVCFQAPDLLDDRNLRLHELAHINTPNQGHTAAWRAEMQRLGVPILPKNQARQRAKKKRS